MAEIATLARPYAEALFRAAGAEAEALRGQVGALAALAADPLLRQFADSPKVSAAQVHDVIAGAAQQQGVALSAKVGNLLRAVLDNGRLSALPEIAAQYAALVDQLSGVAEARVESAFPMDAAQLADVMVAVEKRFGRKLKAQVQVRPELIGGIRVTVGDEVLDTSVKARLEQMKLALVA